MKSRSHKKNMTVKTKSAKLINHKCESAPRPTTRKSTYEEFTKDCVHGYLATRPTSTCSCCLNPRIAVDEILQLA
jgi:hypothetical protein